MKQRFSAWLGWAAVSGLALVLSFTVSGTAQTPGGTCGVCVAGADLGNTGVYDDCPDLAAGQFFSLEKSESCNGCNFTNKVTVTFCHAGICAWKQAHPGAPVLCASAELPCGFRIRWEYMSDCEVVPSVTAIEPGCLDNMFPSAPPLASTLPSTGGNWGQVITDNGQDDVGLKRMVCQRGCTYTFSITDPNCPGTSASVPLKLACGQCFLQHYPGPVGGVSADVPE